MSLDLMLQIKRVLDRDRFYVGYLGFRSSHNEWISSELIHSIMDVEGISLTSSKLQVRLPPCFLPDLTWFVACFFFVQDISS